MNLQGDVLHLIDGSGNIAATYEYDPYGNVLTATGTMAAVNPLRYRGYYYDTETGLYYLQSRYYDPTTGRFLNADAYASTGQGIVGHNMFAYCLNDPVNHIDKSGRIPDDWAGWIGGKLGEIIYEWLTGDDHPSNQTREVEEQIRQKQNESFKKGLQAWWNIYVHSIELGVEAKYQQDMAIIEVGEYFKENPLVAVDAATGVIGAEAGYIGILATAGVVSIPVAGQIAIGIVGLVCTGWGIYRVTTVVWDGINGDNG